LAKEYMNGTIHYPHARWKQI